MVNKNHINVATEYYIKILANDIQSVKEFVGGVGRTYPGIVIKSVVVPNALRHIYDN